MVNYSSSGRIVALIQQDKRNIYANMSFLSGQLAVVYPNVGYCVLDGAS